MVLRIVFVSPLRFGATIVIWFDPNLGSGDINAGNFPPSNGENLLIIDDDGRDGLRFPLHLNHPSVLADPGDLRVCLVSAPTSWTRFSRLAARG